MRVPRLGLGYVSVLCDLLYQRPSVIEIEAFKFVVDNKDLRSQSTAGTVPASSVRQCMSTRWLSIYDKGDEEEKESEASSTTSDAQEFSTPPPSDIEVPRAREKTRSNKPKLDPSPLGLYRADPAELKFTRE